MHEYSIVENLVDWLLKELARQEFICVECVKFRRGSTFSETALREAWEAHTAGTILAGARIYIDTVSRHHRCVCGHEQEVTSEQLVGHFFVCPVCGVPKEIDEAHDLELCEVVGAEHGEDGCMTHCVNRATTPETHAQTHVQAHNHGHVHARMHEHGAHCHGKHH